VQQVAGEKLKLKTGDGIGNGNGSGDGNSNGRKLNLGSKTIQGSKLIQGQIQKKTEQQNKEGPHGSGNHFDV
jgi:hypothetical protein